MAAPQPQPTAAVETEDEAERAAVLATVQADQDRADIVAVLATDEGRRVMRRILAMASLHSPSFATDALVMAFNEGNRNFGLRLLALIADSAPAALAGILIEQPKD